MIFGPRPNPVADELRAQLAAERERSADLLRQLMELRREGFNPPQPQGEAPEIESIPHEVVAAIEMRAPTRQAREKLMQAARRLLIDAQPDEVAEAILEGDGWTW